MYNIKQNINLSMSNKDLAMELEWRTKCRTQSRFRAVKVFYCFYQDTQTQLQRVRQGALETHRSTLGIFRGPSHGRNRSKA